MENMLFNYNNRITGSIGAGNAVGGISPTFGTSLGKVLIEKVFVGLIFIDSVTQANILGAANLRITTFNGVNNYSALIPGLSTGYVKDISFTVISFCYFETSFLIQPNDQVRLIGSYHLNNAATNTTSLTCDINLVGRIIQ